MSDTADSGSGKGPSPANSNPHVGAFVLETLTLGMYGEPRHTLREYVQNSFDAIRAAQRMGFSDDNGHVSITIQPDAIIIKDNGLGIPSNNAWKTLTSIGASKKDRMRDAGFRGIGRLAGMAYCSELVFRTTFPGEASVTTIAFDCDKLLTAMDPDGGGDFELSKLLSTAIKFDQEDVIEDEDRHYFEVKLHGLNNTPKSLTDPDEVRSYLSQTVPVGFDPNWSRASEIEENYKSYFGSSLEKIDVTVHANDSSDKIFKPYGNTYEHAKGAMKLREIDYFPGERGHYWAWVGRLDESAAVTDRSTRGLRIRVRNIQVDGTEIVERLFSDIKPSYGRLSSYYVGEIFIAPEKIIPNARRDGFEELQDWVDIKKSLKVNICQPLSSDAYEASRRGGVDIDVLSEDVAKLSSRVSNIGENPDMSYDHVVDLMNNAKRYRRRIARFQKIVEDLDDAAIDRAEREKQKSTVLQEAAEAVELVESQARMFIGRFLDEGERLASLKLRLRQELLKDVLDVVNAFVDPSTYQKIKERLVKLN